MIMKDEQWKKKLTKEQYEILRMKRTEKPFTGKFLNSKKSGMYTCVACGNILFDSDTKFDSGTGWPSFYDVHKSKDFGSSKSLKKKPQRLFDVAKNKNVKLKEDSSFGMKRVEVICAKCGGHLGHLFDDGFGTPTGKRYCINSCALDFKESKKKNSKK